MGWQTEQGKRVRVLKCPFFSDMYMQKTGLLVLAGHQLLFTAFQEYVGGQGKDWNLSFKLTHTEKCNVTWPYLS